MLLVGTNDLTPKSILPHHTTTPVDRIVEHYKQLLEIIKIKNPNIFIRVSGILPGAFNFKHNKDYLIEVNRALKQIV